MTFNPYTILGVNRAATDKEIKTAYKEKSLQYHPDKEGADETMFANCTAAKNLLLDPNRRNAYDRGGWGLVKRFDEMEQEQERRNMPKCENFVINADITLKQLYNMEKIKLKAKIPQYDDNGERSPKMFEYNDFQVAPEMIGRTVMMQNEGINRSDHLPGDIAIKVRIIPDASLSDFEVEDNNLILNVKLKLSDIINPYNISIRHPDGKTYLVKGQYSASTSANELIFEGMGLPLRHGKGFLVVRPCLDVDSLLNLSSDVKKELLGFLSKHQELYNDNKKMAGGIDITKRGKTLRDVEASQMRSMNGIQMMGGIQMGPSQCSQQ